MVEEGKKEQRSLEEEIEEALKNAKKAAEKGDIHRATAKALYAKDLAENLEPDYKSRVNRRFKEVIATAYSHEKQYLKEAEGHIEEGHFEDAERCYGLALEAASYIDDEEKRGKIIEKVSEGRRKIVKEGAKRAKKLAEQGSYERAAALTERAEDYIEERYQRIESERRWAKSKGKSQKSIDDRLKEEREELKDIQKELDAARKAAKKAKYAPMPEDVSFAELEEQIRATYPLEDYDNRRVWLN